jgi:hypothetical protein
MKIFILEDDENRISLFLTAAKEHDVTLCTSCERAIKMWNPPYDLVLLDHDLAPEHYQALDGDHESTGLTFCKWLVENKPEDSDNLAFIVHSWNPYGGKRMVQVLHEARLRVIRYEFGPGVLDYIKNLGGAQSNATV